MASFLKGGARRGPFGKNTFLRSTQDVKTQSFTLAKGTVPYETIDGYQQKVLQAGEVMAKITSGTNAGKVGPFQAAGTDAQLTVTKAGTWTSGTYTLSYGGQTTAPIQYNDTAATVQAALRALSGLGVDVAVSGGPLNTTPLVVAFSGQQGGQVIPLTALTVDTTNIVGGGTAAVTVSTAGVSGATDGRQTLANIVGLNNTFLPYQALDRDVEIAVIYEATAVQAWCFERDLNGVRTALGNTTAAQLVASKSLSIMFQ